MSMNGEIGNPNMKIKLHILEAESKKEFAAVVEKKNKEIFLRLVILEYKSI